MVYATKSEITKRGDGDKYHTVPAEELRSSSKTGHQVELKKRSRRPFTEQIIYIGSSLSKGATNTNLHSRKDWVSSLKKMLLRVYQEKLLLALGTINIKIVGGQGILHPICLPCSHPLSRAPTGHCKVRYWLLLWSEIT